MKKLLVIFAILCPYTAQAQDYLITFGGTGLSSNVNTVKIENLTAGTSLIINGSDILHLTSILTGVNPAEDTKSSELKIYPNPMTENSTIEINPPVAGEAVITVCEMTGIQVAQIHSFLEISRQDFRISGLGNGFYLINVKGNGYQFSGKLICNAKPTGAIRIEKVNNKIEAVDEKAVKTDSKGTQATIDMAYTTGDRLKFTGISGNYSTVKTDIPASDKTVNFNFIACADCDNNNYPIVEIGTQKWMAENLKTTKLNDCTDIPYFTNVRTWYYLTSPSYMFTDNQPVNKNIYGVLYNWYTVKTDKLCPQGWHVPSDDDWKTLISYLGGKDIAGGKLKETGIAHWYDLNAGATNESGFTALPGGRSDIDLVTPSGIMGMPFLEGNRGTWWSSTEMSTDIRSAFYQQILHNSSNISDLSINKIQGLSVRCLKDEIQVLPVILTSEVLSITQTSASSGGSITSDGGASVTNRGVCWSTSPDPTVSYSKTTDGTRTGVFTSSITGLTAGTTYYVRAYATNSIGTAYGNQIKFSTKIADVDGNNYNTVSIGTQVWMAENLRTTKYNDGTSIPLVTDATTWGGLSTSAYCWYNNDQSTYKDLYGALYNWYAVNTEQLCPSGWRVPGDTDWTTLTDYLIFNGYGYGGTGDDIAKSMASILFWNASSSVGTPGSDRAGNNLSGFTATPGGDRSGTGDFGSVNYDATWWSSSDYNSTNAWYRSMTYNGYGVNRGNYLKPNGFSVRCIKEEIQVLPTITTSAISGLTQSTATTGGVVTDDGGVTVTGRGVCWNTSPDPTISNNKTTNGAGIGDFTSTISGLSPGITYYVKAYAINSIGIAYGNEIIFAAKGGTGSVSDIDGNTYSTIVIGSQTWMAENLKTTKNNDGTSIPLISDPGIWGNLTSVGYSWYDNDATTYKSTYGALYNLYAVDAMRISGKNICPAGWHVPTDTEWTILTDYLTNNGFGNGSSGSNIAKSMAATTVWTTFSNAGTIGNELVSNNSSGFNAMPGGWRGNNGSYYLPAVLFHAINYAGFWWSSTLGPYVQINNDKKDCAWTRSLGSDRSNVSRNSGYGGNGFSVRCLMGETPSLRVITNSPAVNVTQSSANSGGNVTSDGGTAVTGRGVCWSTNPNPTIADNKTSDGTGTGEFTSSISGLSAGTIYYLRAYAINNIGTAYGDQVVISTDISDSEGNIYNTVTLGTQTWMTENLKATKYNDGTAIPLVTENSVWGTNNNGAYCDYENNTANSDTYGRLYNWYVGAYNNTKNVCPAGWHVPTQLDWSALLSYLSSGLFYDNITSQNLVGKSLAATTNWASAAMPGSPGNTDYPEFRNKTGFTALPGGLRRANGTFTDIGFHTYWWTPSELIIPNQPSSNGKSISIDYDRVSWGYYETFTKYTGFSIRCIRD